MFNAMRFLWSKKRAELLFLSVCVSLSLSRARARFLSNFINPYPTIYPLRMIRFDKLIIDIWPNERKRQKCQRKKKIIITECIISYRLKQTDLLLRKSSFTSIRMDHKWFQAFSSMRAHTHTYKLYTILLKNGSKNNSNKNHTHTHTKHCGKKKKKIIIIIMMIASG